MWEDAFGDAGVLEVGVEEAPYGAVPEVACSSLVVVVHPQRACWVVLDGME